jgi:hypothetical protein
MNQLIKINENGGKKLVDARPYEFGLDAISDKEIEEFFNILSKKKKEPKPTRGFIYILLCEDTRHLKIGKAEDPFPRIQSQVVAAPSNIRPLLILFCENYAQAETHLHRKFKRNLVYGKKEWFQIDHSLVFREICNDSYFMLNHFLLVGHDLYPQEMVEKLNTELYRLKEIYSQAS